MGLDALTAVIDELAAVDPRALADGDSIVALHRLQDRLEAIVTRAVACFDTDRQWEADHAHSAGAWITVRCHRPSTQAKAEVARGRALLHLPAVEAAWLRGDIGGAQVALVAAARRPGTQDRLSEDETMLVDHATKLTFRGFTRAMAYWSQLADPDGDDDHAREVYDRRGANLSQSFQGQWFLDGMLEPIGGTIFANELTRLEEQLFHADWAEAKARLGSQPATTDLARTPAQRRADALVEMATRSASTPADGRRPEPLFTVLVGWETLKGRICELANGTVISPSTLLPWLDTAWLQRVVFESPSRVLDVGVARRLFEGATRLAVEVRDQQCFHPLCETPAEDCQVDHIVPYSANGPTQQDNGRLACGYHNRARHQSAPPDRQPHEGPSP